LKPLKTLGDAAEQSEGGSGEDHIPPTQNPCMNARVRSLRRVKSHVGISAFRLTEFAGNNECCEMHVRDHIRGQIASSLALFWQGMPELTPSRK